MPAPAPVGLVCKLAALDDPRSPRGRRHSLTSVLLCALAAMVAGARCLRAIGQWADAAPQHTLVRLGCRITCPALGVRTAPSQVTIRRVLIAVAPDALAALTRPDTFQVVAVDGKTLRGSATGTSAAVHLLAALTPDRRLVAQVRVQAGTSEIDALAALVASLDLTGTTDFPHAVQAVRVRRHVKDLRTGEVSWTCAYAVTSLPVVRADAARLGALVRGHWNIEAWHHVKDASMGEDACKVRSGHAPDSLAALRAVAIALLARLGQDTLPDAVRWVSYEAFTRPLDVIGLA